MFDMTALIGCAFIGSAIVIAIIRSFFRPAKRPIGWPELFQAAFVIVPITIAIPEMGFAAIALCGVLWLVDHGLARVRQ